MNAKQVQTARNTRDAVVTGAQEAPRRERVPTLRILYLVPDLTDPAVHRRISMFKTGRAQVQVAGFHRRPLSGVAEKLTALGQTHDANLLQRVLSVGTWLLRPQRLAELARDCDVIVARNLEMLVLGRYARRLLSDRPSLVYECLDIHGVMLGRGLKSRALRAIEGWLLHACASLIVSSPAFVREYFLKNHGGLPKIRLIENKLFAPNGVIRPTQRPRSNGEPWRIGWFGMIRCRRSLELLKALTAGTSVPVEVVIRGRPTAAVFPDFLRELADHPAIRFEGQYRPEDLPAHYGEVDFTWGMDFYEAGQNSTWLLPNRIYEGGAFDVPALAHAGVETANWLNRHHTGVVLDDPNTGLISLFDELDGKAYAELRRRASRVPRSELICDESECLSLVESLRP